MNRILYTLLLILFLGSLAQAQRHKRFTYLGIEIGAKNGFFKVEDAGTELYTKSTLNNGHQGIFLEQEINYIWSIGSGLYFSKQKMDFRFEQDGGFNIYEPMRLIQIPVQVKASIPLTYGTPEIRLVPLFGGHAVFNISNDQEDFRGRIAPDLANNYTGSIRRDFKSIFPIAEAGLNLDMMFAKGVILSFGGSYFKGFSKIMQADVTYNINKVAYRGSVYSQGDNIALRLALKYPVSRFWKKSPRKKEKKNG